MTKWVPLKGPKENRPNDETRNQFCTEDGYVFTGMFHKSVTGNWYWVTDDSGRDIFAKWWAPLPEAPDRTMEA